jgi:hypothetical protein
MYMIFGDATSISNVTQALAANCSSVIVTPSTPFSDNRTYPAGTNLTLLPELDPTYAESYYRASSFALFSFFTNQSANQTEVGMARINFTVPTTSPVLYDPSMLNATFDACVNVTISNVLPIEAGSFAAVCSSLEFFEAWLTLLRRTD